MDDNKLKIKDYWNFQPCNIKRSKAEVGSFQWCLDTEKNKYFVEPHIKKFANFEKYKNKKVLEIGCGIGIDTCSFAKAGANVTTIDISDKSVELAKLRALKLGLSNIKFYIGDAEDLLNIIPIETYDLIYSFGVIHHTPSPEKIIDNLKYYMNNDTELKIMVYHKFSWKVSWIFIKDFFMDRLGVSGAVAKYSEAQTGCPYTFCYTKKEIKNLLKDFVIKDINIEHIFPYSIPEYKEKIYKKIWYFRIMPIKFFKWLEKKLGWHLCVMAKLK